MEPFAKIFMLVSMGSVTVLAAYTLIRTLKAPPPAAAAKKPGAKK
jgi:hypothetical protein